MIKISKKEFLKALSKMAQSKVTYPDGKVSAFLVDWFDMDAQDAMDFRVLEEPKFHYYSDIRAMQMEWYVEEILKSPFLNALKELNIEIENDE